MTSFRSFYLLLALWNSVTVNAFKLPGPYTIFKTEPTFIPSIINVTHCTEDRSLLAPGYHFIAPHIAMMGYGPQILDNDGNLIWYGNPTVLHFAGKIAYGMDFYVCDFQGEKMNHLCYSEGRPKGGETAGIKHGGANKIFNNAYEPVVEEFVQMGNLSVPNPHEFNVLPGGKTFVHAVYQKTPRDLREYKGPENGTIVNGCIQEIDIASRSVVFQWCFLDHYEPWETYLYLDLPENKENISSSTSGKGIWDNPWDFMHLNAVDKNEEGDYLISSRHLCQLLKIAGPNSASGKPAGTTLWRLNGKHGDFVMDEDAKFARQHHCRFVSTSKNETVITLFNNAFNNSYTKTDRSNGMVLRLNNETMRASLDHLYENPTPQLSIAQGSMTVLPGERKNAYVGWGSIPQWSEFSEHGTLLYNAKTWSYSFKKPKALTNYRAFKFPWVGRPRYDPKLLPYSNTCNGPVMAYVSWNGATEVGSWRFYASDGPDGNRTLIKTVDRDGFETVANLSTNDQPDGFHPWVMVEALDKTSGDVIGNTSSMTFVPSSRIRKHCNENGCFEEKRYKYPQHDSQSCGRGFGQGFSFPALAVLFLVMLAIESWDTVMLRTLHDVVFYGFKYSFSEGLVADKSEKPVYDPVSEHEPDIA